MMTRQRRQVFDCSELRVFWLKWGKPLYLDPMAAGLKIRMNTSHLDNQGLYRGNPQRVGSENLSNLSGYLLGEHWSF